MVSFGVSGSVCRGWAVDLAPTDLQSVPTNGGVVSTPLPSKLLSLASPGLKLKKTEQAWFELKSLYLLVLEAAFTKGETR